MTHSTSSNVEPSLVLAPIERRQASTLDNLLQLYVHDFSEHLPLELGDDGRFSFEVDEVWWTSDGHFPFFIRVGGKLCGFVLVRRGSRISGARDVMDVAEFFVVRGARGKGVGTRVVEELFTTFPGHWEVRVRQTNRGALKFWAYAMEAWSGRPLDGVPVSSGGVDWIVFRPEPTRRSR